MGYIDDTTGKRERQELRREVRRMQTQSPLPNSSVDEGRVRIRSTEGLVIEGTASTTGTQYVSGTLSISGILTGIGSFIWNGIVTLTSVFTANGPWNLNGVGTITGDSTQTGNMTVNSPGTIVVAGSNAMTLGVGAFGIPGVGFASGGGVSGFTGGALLHGGSLGVGCIVNGSAVQIANGSSWVIVKSTGTEVDGTLFFKNLPTVSAVGKTPNVWMDANNKVWKLI